MNQARKSKCVYDVFATKSFRSRLEQTNGLTRPQVGDLVRDGVPGKPIGVEFYYSDWIGRNVIGYTYEGDPKVYLNTRYRVNNYWDLCAEVSNLFHETLHKPPFSFDHDFKATERRPYSVPYTGNRAIEHCCIDGKMKP